jgi:alpha-beta hydrolase superfamily lysophospholipase
MTKWMEFNWNAPDGTRLHGKRWWPENPPLSVVILVHGLGDHSARLDPVARRLNQAGIAVASYDQRGHGLTGGKLPSFQVLAQDIDAFVEHVRPLSDSPRFLYGISLGGGLVLEHALRSNLGRGIHGVIASSPLLRPGFQPPAWKLRIARYLHDWWPSFTLPSGLDPEALSRDPVAVEAYRNDPLVHPRVSAALGLSMLRAGEESLQHAAALRLPVLLMHGTQDRITSPEASQEFALRSGGACELRLWEGAFHDLHFETNREEVLQTVCDWICNPSRIAVG